MTDTQDATVPTHACSSPGTHCERPKRSALEPPCLSPWLTQRCKRQAMCRLPCAGSHHLAPEYLGGLTSSLHVCRHDCPQNSASPAKPVHLDTHPLAEALALLSCPAGRAACMTATMFLSSSSSASQSLLRLGHPGLGLQCCGRCRHCCSSSGPLAATAAL